MRRTFSSFKSGFFVQKFAVACTSVYTLQLIFALRKFSFKFKIGKFNSLVYKSFLLTFTLFLCVSTDAFAYRNKKVVLVANRATQEDSIGHNLVYDLSKVVYEGIKSGKIQLWDSPQKKYQLKKEELAGLEKSSNLNFVGLPNIFIYEYWTSKRKSFDFTIEGFSFAGENRKKEEVLFGYIEMNESLKKLLENTNLQVNANGIYGQTIWQALMNKNYDFDVLLFDGEPVKNLTRSNEIQSKALAANKKLKTRIHLNQSKLVTYSIETGPSEFSAQSAETIELFEKFFNQNPQEFYNYGGDKILSYLKKSPIMISSILVQEEWIKENNRLKTKTISIIPVSFGSALDSISIKQLDEWQLKLNEKDLKTILNSKQFYYIIHNINNMKLPTANSSWYKDALLNKKWNQIVSKENR